MRYGSPRRDVARTLSALLGQLYDYVAKSRDVMSFDVPDGVRRPLPRAA
jgi:hypothetical protein